MDAQGSWGHTYAQANALPAEHKVVLTTDGTTKQFVFDLSSFSKQAQTGASAWSNTSTTTYGFTVNISSNMTDNAAVKAWFANSRVAQ